MGRNGQGYGRSRRLKIIELLIVVGIVVIVAAIAIPAFASQAKKTVLRRNADTLALEVKSRIALDECGCDLSAEIADDVRSGDLGEFINPCSGSRAIVCDLHDAAASQPPAVLVSDDPAFAFRTFRPSSDVRSRLAGTLVVSISGTGGASSVDVYFVDPDGSPSPSPSAVGITGETALLQ
jgi:Tfp pilus assembly major pilin PilA